tara:strand:- start:228 stop:962 length:735 start_codon:yes stop_codon:yes gene_type:complete
MAYYTGRDVDVYWTTEHDSAGINEHTDLEIRMTEAPDSANETIVRPLVDLGEATTKLTDVTGVDVSVGAQDEDISYMGLRNVGKIEVKKDTSVTVTMKKKDRKFLQLYQGNTYSGNSNASGGHPARWGLIQTGAGGSAVIQIQDGTVDPKSCVDPDSTTKTTYGYRLVVEFKASSTATGVNGALLVIPNCTISEVTHTTSNEAADEESVTFTSQVKPMVGDGKRTGAGTAFVSYAVTSTLLTDV